MIYGVILFFSFFSFSQLKIDFFPDITFPFAGVITSYSGVGSEDIENLITRPVEEAVSSVKNIEKKALELNAKSRAKLANKLLSSLEDLSEAEIQKLWAEEAIRRNDEIEKGKVKLRSSDEVFTEARKRFK